MLKEKIGQRIKEIRMFNLSPENVSKVAKDMVSYYNASIDNNAEIKILEDFINDHRQEAEQLAEGHPDGNRKQIRG